MRPSVSRKAQPVDPKRRCAVVASVVVVVDQCRQRLRTIRPNVSKHALPARPYDVAVRAQQNRSPAVSQLQAAAVQIRPGRIRRSPINNAVGTRRTTAGIDGSKVIVVLIPVVDE